VAVAGISFLRPEALWAVPALAAAWLVWRVFRRRRFVAFSAVKQVRQLGHHPSPVRRLPAVLILLSLLMILGALMDPVVPFAESKIEAQGLDIVLVVDLSSSMLETMGLYTEGRATAPTDTPVTTPAPVSNTPTAPGVRGGATRLEVTKGALRDFINRRRNDRIGLVVFSDNAYVVSPLTFDYNYLRQYVDSIDDQLLRREGMTAIGDGIYLANVLLAKQSDANVRNKVIVVLTDGEHNIGRDPIEALADTDAAGVRAHLIGVDLEKVIRGRPAVVKLIDTVRHYGGQYFQANSAQQLQAANRALASLEKGKLAGRRFELNVPIFHWFTMPALILLVAALGLRVFPYFTDVT
jgi:Ca-activated chloride channel family protein